MPKRGTTKRTGVVKKASKPKKKGALLKKPAEKTKQPAAGFIIDDALEVVEFLGHTGPYLDIAPGGAGLNLRKLLRPSLFADVKQAIDKGRSRGATVRRRGLRFLSGGEVRRAHLVVEPMPAGSPRRGRWRIFLEEVAARKGRKPAKQGSAKDAPTVVPPSVPELVQAEMAALQDHLAKEITDQEEKYAALLRQLRTEEHSHQTAAAELVTTNAELEASNAELQVTLSEREVAQKEAEEREREFRLLAENVPELFSYVGPDERYRFVNKRYEEFFGRSRKQLVGKHMKDVLGEPAYQKARAHIRAALAGRRNVFEDLRTSPVLGPRWVRAQYVPDLRKDGRVSGVFMLVSDITAQKETQETIEQQGAFRSAILDTMDALVVVLDRDGGIVSFNQACEKVAGYAFEEIQGEGVWKLLDPEEASSVRDVFAELLEGRANRHTNHWLAKDGTRRLIAWSNTFLRDSAGVVQFVIGTGLDITESAEVEQALRHSEARAAALLESAAQAILAVDEDGKIGLVNKTAEEMFGYSRSDLLGQRIETLIPDRFRKKHIEHRKGYFADPHSRPMGVGFELYGKKKDGTEFPIEVGLSFVEPRDGLTSVAFVSDITARRQVEEARRVSEERFRIAAECGNDLIYEWDLRTNQLTWWGVIESRLGDRPGTLQEFEERMHPDDHDPVMREVAENLESGKRFEAEYRVRAADGTYRNWWDRGTPIRDASGKPYKWIGTCTDITRRKRTEDELSHNREQLRALTARLLKAHEEERRALARHLHDELTQTVAVLGMEIGMIGREIPSELSEIQQKLAVLAGQVRGLSNDIRSLSHRLHPSALEHAGLGEALRGYCKDFTARHGLRANVVVRAMPDALPRAIAGALYHIAIEALQNAARHSRAESVQVRLTGGDGLLRMAIIDNGIGFDEAQVRGGSENLGLVSMKERARLIGASLEVKSVPNEGTRVKVDAPLETE